MHFTEASPRVAESPNLAKGYRMVVDEFEDRGREVSDPERLGVEGVLDDFAEVEVVDELLDDGVGEDRCSSDDHDGVSLS